MRFMSSSNTTGNDDKAENEGKQANTAIRKALTDPAFANYLTGKIPNKSTEEQKSLLGRRKATKRRTKVIFEDEKELLDKIQRNQLRQKEISRQKTAKNGRFCHSVARKFSPTLSGYSTSIVYRALMGNVVICGGTFTIGQLSRLTEAI